MYATRILQWWHIDKWEEIGWRANSPFSAIDLKTHGAKMAASGGKYRMIMENPKVGEPPIVLQTWN
jgi:hypothetical protein